MGGLAPALSDLIGGQVQVIFSSVPAAIEYVRALDELCRERRHSPSLVICPAEFYCYVAALDVARRGETLKECCYAVDTLPRRTKGQVPDLRQRQLLRARCHRPRHRAPETRDEIAPLHNIKRLKLDVTTHVPIHGAAGPQAEFDRIVGYGYGRYGYSGFGRGGRCGGGAYC
jgi:hypothetical protein